MATRMEANCKRVIETIAPQQESHDVTEPIGPLSLHYEGISGLLKTQRPYIQYAFEKGLFTKETKNNPFFNNRTLSSNTVCGLSLLLVLPLAPRGFSPSTPVFPSPQKLTFPNSNSTRNQVDEESLCGCATCKWLFINLFCLFIYVARYQDTSV